MEIQWIKNGCDGLVSIYETNITLNTIASQYFDEAYNVVIGFDASNCTLVIKSLNKEEATNGVYMKNDLHPISIKASYGRINGKTLIKNISKFYPLDFKAKTYYKFGATWDVETKSLIIKLKEVLN